MLWWEKYVLQSEWHHAWPQWLGGAENQTKICFPKVMHNFDGITTEQGKFPVGFHQHLNAKIKATFGEAFSINDARGWADYRRVTPGAVAKMGTLIIDSYENVFKRFRAKDEAKNKFVSEAESELDQVAGHYDAHVTERIYRMSAKRGRVAAAGAPPRQPTLQAGWVSWDIPETELSDIPVLREWFHAHRVRGVEESGFVSRTESLPSDGEPYSIIAIPWTPWRGTCLDAVGALRGLRTEHRHCHTTGEDGRR